MEAICLESSQHILTAYHILTALVGVILIIVALWSFDKNIKLIIDKFDFKQKYGKLELVNVSAPFLTILFIGAGVLIVPLMLNAFSNKMGPCIYLNLSDNNAVETNKSKSATQKITNKKIGNDSILYFIPASKSNKVSPISITAMEDIAKHYNSSGKYRVVIKPITFSNYSNNSEVANVNDFVNKFLKSRGATNFEFDMSKPKVTIPCGAITQPGLLITVTEK